MWEQIRLNQQQSGYLLAGLAVFLLVLGYFIGELIEPGFGLGGLAVAFILWIVQSLVAYYAGGKIFLSMVGARQISRDDHPTLYNIVEEMKIASGLPAMPQVYIIDEIALNAFATGRDPEHAAVAVTSGLLEHLDRDELQGVIGHELAHIQNRDSLFMTMASVMLGTIVMLSEIGFRSMYHGGHRRRTSHRSNGGGQAAIVLMVVAVILMVLSPLIAQLLYYAISRKREYLADACSARLTRYPEGLARALEKLARGNTQKMDSVNKAMAPLFIVNPLNITEQGLSDLTSTHPPISERVKILRAMAGGAGYQNYDEAYRKITGRPVGVVPYSAILDTQAEARPLKEASAVLPAISGNISAATETPGLSETGRSLSQRQTQAQTHQERVRETTDALWKINDYAFISCTCGVTFKVPPARQGQSFRCIHCGVRLNA